MQHPMGNKMLGVSLNYEHLTCGSSFSLCFGNISHKDRSGGVEWSGGISRGSSDYTASRKICRTSGNHRFLLWVWSKDRLFHVCNEVYVADFLWLTLIDFFLFSSFASYMSILRLTANILCGELGGTGDISSGDYQIRKYQRDSENKVVLRYYWDLLPYNSDITDMLLKYYWYIIDM